MRDRRPWIQWDRIQADWQAGMPPRVCAQRENSRRDQEGENRRITAQQISNEANLRDWTRPWKVETYFEPPSSFLKLG